MELITATVVITSIDLLVTSDNIHYQGNTHNQSTEISLQEKKLSNNIFC